MATVELNAPITAVTVFTNRARITRIAEQVLEAGETTLILAGLPEVMEADSVRVSGLGAGVTIRGVDVKPDVLAEDSDEQRQLIRQELEKLSLQSKAFTHQHKTLEARIAYYEALQQKTSEAGADALLTESTSFERVTAIANYVQTQLDQTYAQMRDVNEQWGLAQLQWQRLNARLTQNDARYAFSGNAIYIAVETEAPVNFIIKVEYVVTGAAWEPIYDVRLLGNNEVELTYMARIAQNTGENWENIQLALSTARPTAKSTLPDLDIWYLDDPEEKALRSVRDQRAVREGMKAEASLRQQKSYTPYGWSEESWKKQQAKVQQTTIKPAESGVSVTYHVGTPVTIAGTGEPHKTTVTITNLKTELDYLTVPKAAPEAYLRARITNTSEYTLLPGEASIFHENDFVGKTQLKTIAPNEEFTIQLGVDERLKVERELVKREAGKNFIGTQAQTHYRYEIRLTNLLDKATKVTVQDHYPLSRSSRITVKLDDVNPKPNEETDLQVLTWTLNLPAESKRTITLTFSVETGRTQTVYGLDD